MNSKQAKSISIKEILRRLGIEPTRQVNRGIELFYISPLREGDKKPSFKVDTEMNVWYEHGLGRGGNVLDFVIEYMQYKGHAVKPGIREALDFMDNLFGGEIIVLPPKINPVQLKKKKPVIVVQSVNKLHHPALLEYLKERGIEDIDVAGQYVKEVNYNYKDSNQSQSFFAIGLENKSGGYALRNRNWKQASSPNDFSIISGKRVSEQRVSVFEGMMDFLSFLVLEKCNQLFGDVIVLNSLSFVQPAANFIIRQGYRVVHTLLDNDTAGQEATQRLQIKLRAKGIFTVAQNGFYEGYHDINDFLTNQGKPLM